MAALIVLLAQNTGILILSAKNKPVVFVITTILNGDISISLTKHMYLRNRGV